MFDTFSAHVSMAISQKMIIVVTVTCIPYHEGRQMFSWTVVIQHCDVYLEMQGLQNSTVVFIE